MEFWLEKTIKVLVDTTDTELCRNKWFGYFKMQNIKQKEGKGTDGRKSRVVQQSEIERATDSTSIQLNTTIGYGLLGLAAIFLATHRWTISKP